MEQLKQLVVVIGLLADSQSVVGLSVNLHERTARRDRSYVPWGHRQEIGGFIVDILGGRDESSISQLNACRVGVFYISIVVLGKHVSECRACAVLLHYLVNEFTATRLHVAFFGSSWHWALTGARFTS